MHPYLEQETSLTPVKLNWNLIISVSKDFNQVIEKNTVKKQRNVN